MTIRCPSQEKHSWLQAFAESELCTGAMLVEICTAALTTEPELRDVGRSLISLVRYHSDKHGSVGLSIPPGPPSGLLARAEPFVFGPQKHQMGQ
jgi:hypothetical protein